MRRHHEVVDVGVVVVVGVVSAEGIRGTQPPSHQLQPACVSHIR